MQAVYGAIWGNWLDEVGKARPKSKLAAYVGNPVAASNAAQGDLGKAALNAGLIDRLGDRTAFGIHVAKFAGVEDDDMRQEARSVGKEGVGTCRSRGAPNHK